MDFGKAIKELRTRAGLSQRELASRLRITTPALWKLENGKCVPKFGTIKKVCAEFHVPLAYFLNKAATIEDFIITP